MRMTYPCGMRALYWCGIQRYSWNATPYKRWLLDMGKWPHYPTVEQAWWLVTHKMYWTDLDTRPHEAVELAQVIFVKRRYDMYPILADLLEDGGVSNEAILNQLRNSWFQGRGNPTLLQLVGSDFIERNLRSIVEREMKELHTKPKSWLEGDWYLD